MIRERKPYFIDFQGGLRGPEMYDLASLLNQARAGIPEDLKLELLAHYFELNSSKYTNFESFKSNFSLFSILRTLQTLGAYGFRGLHQGKEHFIKSIRPALINLKGFLSQIDLREKDYLLEIIDEVEGRIPFMDNRDKEELEVNLTSFSYKQGGIPKDFSGNGGGFVFDCRGILNPGRFDDYKHLSGLDAPVVTFLRSKTDADSFVNSIMSTIMPTIENYMGRGFSNLSISFGCTGGQHRSVYCAEEVAKRLSEIKGLALKLNHREKPNWEKQ